MIGCPHNAQRTLVYPAPLGRESAHGVRSFTPGQTITLICPQGCPDVTWALQGGHPETHIHHPTHKETP